VEWHPTKGLLASGSKDKLVKFWDPRTGQALSAIYSHKNTIQAIAWSNNGDMIATASRDQTLRVFDIRAMKELQCFKGHKKEVCSVAWHPVHHSILVSGGSEGSIIHWSLDSSVPAPRASVDQAHDSNVWCLAFHPLGHILASASNDYTTRFWCRERPTDVGGEWKSGGEKPPEIGAADEDEDYVPGLGFAGGMGGQDGFGFGGNTTSYGDDFDRQPGGGQGVPGLGGSGGFDGGNGFIPGFGGGAGVGPAVGRERGPLPSQDALFPSPGGPGGGGRGGRGRRNQSRWGDY